MRQNGYFAPDSARSPRPVAAPGGRPARRRRQRRLYRVTAAARHPRALAYGQEVIAAASGPDRLSLIAQADSGLAGTVQIHLAAPNGRHRAEVARLVVHTRYRHRGSGRALMLAVEAETGTPAAAHSCSTLATALGPSSFI